MTRAREEEENGKGERESKQICQLLLLLRTLQAVAANKASGHRG